MNFGRSGNPTLNEKTFERYGGAAYSQGMTLEGTVNKTLIAFIILVASALYTWNMYFDGHNPTTFMVAGVIGGGILGLLTSFIPRIAPFTVPVYALLEGMFVGALSAMYEAEFSGITVQAVLLTFGVFLALLFAYKTRLIKATENFKLGVFAATAAIAIVYLVNIVLNLFFSMSVPYLHDTGWIGIVISLVIVAVAALNLVLDFDFIENGVRAGAPKYMEWYGAFGLMVTLVWLYIEILRLLAKLSRRD
ncbi:Bax inhibitor-1/YccA family protein [Paenibacillus thermotolerans]|uniref:Bax inhibitor-1/YccA family protein n=1 Tax=Paenibacillus thermotolerans TaxID=3027807 RepID=UPI002368BE94|nr:MULTISPECIES: Bax inhibitor-1/YccA family protein [unclassified Paenibacillus]